LLQADPGHVAGSADRPKVVELRQVGKGFRNRGGRVEYAIRGVSFEQYEGDFHCLLGPSGSGKTTILNLLAGFLDSTEGEILVAGRRVSGPGPDRAMVFQDYGLLPWQTVQGNVNIALKIQGVPKAEREARVAEYIELVGLAGATSKYPHQLSGGMQQRVSIARALAMHPVMLLMDEPFGGLDAHTRLLMQGELVKIWEETRKTVLFVTHSVDEAIYLADRVLIIGESPGHILEDIAVDLPRPRNRTSEAFNRIKREVLNIIGGGD